MMINEENKDELVEQYLLGQLTGESLTAFEKRLATDSAFRQEVALERTIIKNIKTAGRKEWAAKLDSFHQEMETTDTDTEEAPVIPLHKVVLPGKRNNQNLYFAIAAAIVLLLLATVVLITINNQVTPDQVFVAYYQPYTSVEQTSRTPTGAALERTQAFGFYNAGQYPEAIAAFNNLLASSEDETVLFYLGNAYLSADKPQEAEEIFKRYLNKYQEFRVEARWYLSLSYLKQQKLPQAQTLLRELAQQNNDYSNKAKEILKSLD